jgi:hypothetical protein
MGVPAAELQSRDGNSSLQDSPAGSAEQPACLRARRSPGRAAHAAGFLRLSSERNFSMHSGQMPWVKSTPVRSWK